MKFSLDRFIQDCREALAESDSQAAVRQVVKRAVTSPGEVIRELGEPELAGLETLYHADDLTILNIVWAPDMTLHPHNHNMWANIGIYGGLEQNTFYQRGSDGLMQKGEKLLEQKDVASLHKDVIHSVHNPCSKLTTAIHVYGGDFFATPRSEWPLETLEEQPFDIEHTRAVFNAANKKILAAD